MPAGRDRAADVSAGNRVVPDPAAAAARVRAPLSADDQRPVGRGRPIRRRVDRAGERGRWRRHSQWLRMRGPARTGAADPRRPVRTHGHRRRAAARHPVAARRSLSPRAVQLVDDVESAMSPDDLDTRYRASTAMLRRVLALAAEVGEPAPPSTIEFSEDPRTGSLATVRLGSARPLRSPAPPRRERGRRAVGPARCVSGRNPGRLRSSASRWGLRPGRTGRVALRSPPTAGQE